MTRRLEENGSGEGPAARRGGKEERNDKDNHVGRDISRMPAPMRRLWHEG
jgi:hypothetical protein